MLPVLLKNRIREKLINDAIRDLRRWMFPLVNEKSIFTDVTYSHFFELILEKQKGLNKDVDLAIDELLYEVKYTIKNI